MGLTFKDRGPQVLFGLVFVVVGLGATVLIGARTLEQRQRAATFVANECTITRHEVASKRSDGDTMYRPTVHYVYTVDRTAYAGDRIGFTSPSASLRSYAEGMLARYPVGTRQPCWYDPRDPSEVVLDRSTAGALLFTMVPLGFGLLGLAVIVKALGRPQLAYDPRSPGMAGGGPCVLVPRRERAHDLLLSAGFALPFGAAGLGLIGMARMSGAPWVWVTAVLFGAVGLGLTAWFLRNLVRTFGMRARLVLAGQAVALGSSVELRYTLRGAGRRMFRQVSLVGQEEETHTADGESQTDTREFHRETLVAFDDRQREGTAMVRLPMGAMHSRQTEHGRTVWLIEVRAQLGSRWWLMCGEDYEIVVTPAGAIRV